ncbi:hypothetical protein Y032_0558g3422 [Ancylostoma ceylanicum]|uniref:Uncharacterized protein n=1 Tax=Ancylostoma ceylanicum TaxID=53326 RepID=A0A016WQ73_9BILA|nr:hypothetical protein Y032_0558g3422 [Ancylostoma ceylanicum]
MASIWSFRIILLKRSFFSISIADLLLLYEKQEHYIALRHARYSAGTPYAVCGASVLCFHHIPPKRRLCLTFPAGSADLPLLKNDKSIYRKLYPYVTT